MSTLAVLADGCEFEVDLADGKILKRFGSNESEYSHIARFDTGEFCEHYAADLPSTTDILSIGYWNTSGSYDPPESSYREMMLTGDSLVQ